MLFITSPVFTLHKKGKSSGRFEGMGAWVKGGAMVIVVVTAVIETMIMINIIYIIRVVIIRKKTKVMIT